MKCPNCASLISRIVDSGEIYGTQTWRLRECLKCRTKYPTHEVILESDAADLLEARRIIKAAKSLIRSILDLDLGEGPETKETTEPMTSEQMIEELLL